MRAHAWLVLCFAAVLDAFGAGPTLPNYGCQLSNGTHVDPLFGDSTSCETCPCAFTPDGPAAYIQATYPAGYTRGNGPPSPTNTTTISICTCCDYSRPDLNTSLEGARFTKESAQAWDAARDADHAVSTRITCFDGEPLQVLQQSSKYLPIVMMGYA